MNIIQDQNLISLNKPSSLMGLIGMGSNPMVGATVAVEVATK